MGGEPLTSFRVGKIQDSSDTIPPTYQSWQFTTGLPDKQSLLHSNSKVDGVVVDEGVCPQRHLETVLLEFLKHSTGVGKFLRVEVELSVISGVAVVKLQVRAREAVIGDFRGVMQQLLLSYRRFVQSPRGPYRMFEHFRRRDFGRLWKIPTHLKKQNRNRAKLKCISVTLKISGVFL